MYGGMNMSYNVTLRSIMRVETVVASVVRSNPISFDIVSQDGIVAQPGKVEMNGLAFRRDFIFNFGGKSVDIRIPSPVVAVASDYLENKFG